MHTTFGIATRTGAAATGAAVVVTTGATGAGATGTGATVSGTTILAIDVETSTDDVVAGVAVVVSVLEPHATAVDKASAASIPPPNIRMNVELEERCVENSVCTE